MAVSLVSSNYTGRKRDLSVFHSPDASLATTQSIGISFGAPSQFCAGVQKLVQAYAIILLTNLMSQPNYPEFGTSFLYTMQSGVSPVDTLAASQIFSLASYDAVSALRTYQATNYDTPADERIVRATLTNIVLSAGSALFEVTIVAESGDTIPFLVPLPK